jgi:hypothetical protein
MKRTLSIAALAATLAGCAVPNHTVSTPMPRPPFPEAEYARLPKTGTAIVTGQAFLKTRGGDVKTAAGNTIYLNPVTSYSTYAYEFGYLGTKRMTPPDARLHQYMRETIADGSGRFTFRNVPSGEYFVTANVTWEAPTGYQFSMQTQGGSIWKKIKVQNGDESVDVMVTR